MKGTHQGPSACQVLCWRCTESPGSSRFCHSRETCQPLSLAVPILSVGCASGAGAGRVEPVSTGPDVP